MWLFSSQILSMDSFLHLFLRIRGTINTLLFAINFLTLFNFQEIEFIMTLASLLALSTLFNSTLSYKDSGKGKGGYKLAIDYNDLTKESINNFEINRSVQFASLRNIKNDTIIRLEGQNIRVSSSNNSISVNFHLISNTTFHFVLSPCTRIEFLGRFISTLILRSSFTFHCFGDTNISIPATPWMDNLANIRIDSHGYLTIRTNCSILPILITQRSNKLTRINFDSRDLKINGKIELSGNITFHSIFTDSKIYLKSLEFSEYFSRIEGNVHYIYIDDYITGPSSVFAPSISLEMDQVYIFGCSQIVAPEIRVREVRIEWLNMTYSNQFFVSVS